MAAPALHPAWVPASAGMTFSGAWLRGGNRCGHWTRESSWIQWLAETRFNVRFHGLNPQPKTDHSGSSQQRLSSAVGGGSVCHAGPLDSAAGFRVPGAPTHRLHLPDPDGRSRLSLTADVHGRLHRSHRGCLRPTHRDRRCLHSERAALCAAGGARVLRDGDGAPDPGHKLPHWSFLQRRHGRPQNVCHRYRGQGDVDIGGVAGHGKHDGGGASGAPYWPGSCWKSSPRAALPMWPPYTR